MQKKIMLDPWKKTAIRLSVDVRPDLNPASALSSASWRNTATTGLSRDQTVKGF